MTVKTSTFRKCVHFLPNPTGSSVNRENVVGETDRIFEKIVISRNDHLESTHVYEILRTALDW